jgi:hypothetical protein
MMDHLLSLISLQLMSLCFKPTFCHYWREDKLMFWRYLSNRIKYSSRELIKYFRQELTNSNFFPGFSLYQKANYGTEYLNRPLHFLWHFHNPLIYFTTKLIRTSRITDKLTKEFNRSWQHILWNQNFEVLSPKEYQ